MRTLNEALDTGPLDGQHSESLLEAVARALCVTHATGEYWDHCGNSIVIDDGGEAAVVRTTVERHRTLPPGQVDVERDVLPPEYIDGKMHDARSDIFAWGVFAYESLTGRSPFARDSVLGTMTAYYSVDHEPVSKRRANCDPKLSALISKCLAREPSERFQSARELLSALTEVAW